jgi:Predicted periplasmic lipoprotein (DUF2279)
MKALRSPVLSVLLLGTAWPVLAAPPPLMGPPAPSVIEHETPVQTMRAPDPPETEPDSVSNEPVLPFLASAEEGADYETPKPYDLATFGHQAGSVKLEIVLATAAITATRYKDITKGGGDFYFKSEGWFGKSTKSLGMDKVHHAYKTYVLTDVLQSIISNRLGDGNGPTYTATILGLGLMTYAEVLDGFTKRTGFSNEDMIAHAAGASISLLRNTVPGVREKLDFRMLANPSSFGKRTRLIEQLGHRKYLLAVQLSGFEALKRTPWRFAELHAGYYARGFTEEERARGAPLRRKLYVGIGINVQQFFAAKPRSRVERIAKGILDYLQLPYTATD